MLRIGILISLIGSFFISLHVSAETDRDRYSDDEIILSAPPRETPQEGQIIYGPVAKYLSNVLGKKVTYQHPGNWTIFRIHMQKGNYDLIFDGAHLNSYRAEKLNHNILVKAPSANQYVLIVRQDKARLRNIGRLVGRTICALAPPHLATIMVLDQFKNPVRQPLIVNTEGWANIYKNVQTGKCEGGILPTEALDNLDKTGEHMRVLFTTSPLPNQALSAGPRLSKQEQEKIVQALVTEKAIRPTAKLRETFLVGKGFIPATNQEYTGLAKYLENQLGYY